ncbi:hypothetical protein I7I48_05828 [Histoplasma ohiense]|nr:hypothetical protein I7I48_05828 [Histoplasma ohiense (nom. inval.)]
MVPVKKPCVCVCVCACVCVQRTPIVLADFLSRFFYTIPALTLPSTSKSPIHAACCMLHAERGVNITSGI